LNLPLDSISNPKYLPIMTNTMTTAIARADFSNPVHLRDFVERIASWLLTRVNGDTRIVDFGADNLSRPPAITFAPELPALMQPRIYFRYDARKGRLSINVGWPVCDNDGGWGGPSADDTKGVVTEITVSADKPAATIARDIANRMLPTYLPLHKELQRRIAVHQQDARNAQELAKRLAKDGAWLTAGRDRAGFIEYLKEEGGDLRATVECRGSGTVKITLDDLDETQAAAVLALLRGGGK
jgi:hypothetical protein